MSEEKSKLDLELARIDLASRATHLLRSIGLPDETASDAYAALAPKFAYENGVLSFVGKPADADSVVAWLKENNRAHFLPPDHSTTTNKSSGGTAEVKAPKMDAALLASARAGNMTAKSRLAKAHGLAAVDAALAGTAGDHTSDAERRSRAALSTKQASTAETPAEREAGKNNPWTAENWNATRQSQIVKALGMEAAQRIAKAASSYVGSARPAGSKPPVITRAFSVGA